MKKFLSILAFLLLIAGLGLFGGYRWLEREVSPMPTGEKFYVRFEQGTSLSAALVELQDRKVIRNPDAATKWIRLKKLPDTIHSGTFELMPGMTLEGVLAALQDPVSQMVRLPEGWWIARSAEILEKNNVCTAAEYIKLAAEPARFADVVSFDLPEESLEGFLYPDTYDLPPLLGAEQTIIRQLKAFEDKVLSETDVNGEELRDAVISASIIELEAALDEERAVIAGVIKNRIDINMKLDMDASVLYALQEWRVLGRGEVSTVDSPYNTYLNRGLPPGPIGSPTAKSIAAALAPADHNYFYYVARPDRTHLFARSYSAHRANIRKARKEWAAQEDEG
jgi:UPF0755 protein